MAELQGMETSMRGGALESNREEPGRMHLVRRCRLFEGISDSDQAAVSPQAEAG